MASFQTRFRQSAPDRLEIRKGGGCIGLFGLPFLLAGIFMLLISVRVVPMSNADEVPWWSWIIIGLMSLAFSGVGAALVFGRSWITIDRKKRQVWTAKGLIRPMSGAAYDLDAYDMIVLRHASGDSDSPDHYPIGLRAKRDEAELPLNDISFYGDALDEALLLSRFLDLPFSDRSTDHEKILTPKGIDGKASGRPSAPPAYVPELDCRVSESADELLVAFRGGRVRVTHLLGALIPLLMFALFSWRFLPILFSAGTPMAVSLFFSGFAALFLVLGPVGALLRVLLLAGRETLILVIQSGKVILQSRGIIARKTLSINAEDIVGFDFSTPLTLLARDHGTPPAAFGSGHRPVKPGETYVPDWAYKIARWTRSKGVVIKGKRGMHYVGAGLPDEQVQYLHHLISDAFYRLNPATIRDGDS